MAMYLIFCGTLSRRDTRSAPCNSSKIVRLFVVEHSPAFVFYDFFEFRRVSTFAAFVLILRFLEMKLETLQEKIEQDPHSCLGGSVSTKV